MSRQAIWFLPLMAITGLWSAATAEFNQADPDFRFVLSGMRSERLKVHSGLCHLKGRYAVLDPNNPNRSVDGPLAILTAFDGQDRIRFDREQPGWVVNQETVRADPSGKPGLATADMKRGVEKYKFYDDGKKAAFWSEDELQINVMPSLGNKPNRFLNLGYFDVRGLGMYYYGALQRQKRFNELFDGYSAMKVQPGIDRTDPELWLIKQVDVDGPMEAEMSISVNVGNGFTPVKYTARHRNVKLGGEWHTQEERTTNWEMRNDVWVPVNHSYIFSPSKGAWRQEVSFTIAWEKVNEPIDPDYFNYKSFEAPERVGVVDSSLGFPITVKDIGPPPSKASRWRTPVLIVTMVSAAIAAIGGVAIFRKHRRRVVAN